PVADAHGAVEEGKGDRGAAGARDEHVGEFFAAEEDARSGVEIVGDDAERFRHGRKAVGNAAPEEELLEEALELVEAEEARGKRVVEAIELLPEVLGGGGGSPRGEATGAVAEGADAGRNGPPPLVEVH